MIPREIFYFRLEQHCKLCSEWDGVCLRGHALQSPAGCPMRKFEPILSAEYAEDRGRVTRPKSATGGCAGCGAPVDPDALPALTWPQVLANFGESMERWVAAGMPLTPGPEHDRRNGICNSNQCGQFRGYYCKLCKCVTYTKSGLATEYCPLGKW
jgi:hypothetical protein